MRPEMVLGLVAVLVFAGVVFVILRVGLALLGGFLGMVSRTVSGGGGCESSTPDQRSRTARVLGTRVCAQTGCRHVNPEVARYCAQCGSRL